MNTQTKFFSVVGGGAAGLLLFAFGIHYLSTHGGETVQVQGKLIRRSDNSPVSGAQIFASETPVMVLSKKAGEESSMVLGGTQAFPLKPLGVSAADGSFKVEAPKAPGATVLAVHSELAAALTRVTNLEKKESAEAVSVVVESPCSLMGEVYDEAGEPDKGVFLSLVPFGLLEKPRWQTWTDETGKFLFDKLPVGRLTVSVLFPKKVASQNAEYTASAVVTVAAGEKSFIHFGPSGSLIGRVKDAAGKIIPNAELMFRSSGFSAEGGMAANLRTKAGGDYRLFALPSRPYRAFVRNPDPKDEPEWIDAGLYSLPRNGERWEDIALSGASLLVRIAPESAIDHPFPQTLPKLNRAPVRRLLVFPKGSSQPSYDLTNEMSISGDGKKGVYDSKYQIFNIRSIPPGEYTLVSQVEGYGAGVEENVKVNADTQSRTLTVFLTRGGPVVVQVKDPSGQDVKHASISIWLEDRIEIVRGAPGEDLCPGPGSFTLRVIADGYKSKTQNFNVLVATTKSFTVTLDPEKEK